MKFKTKVRGAEMTENSEKYRRISRNTGSELHCKETQGDFYLGKSLAFG